MLHNHHRHFAGKFRCVVVPRCLWQTACLHWSWVAWLSPIYTIQPVVKPVVKRIVKPVWQPGKCLYTRYNRLYNPVWQPNELFIQHGCQTGLYNRFDNRVEQTVAVVCATGCLYNQLSPVWQLVVSCEWGFRVISKLVVPFVSWTTRKKATSFLLRSTKWHFDMEMKSLVCRCVFR